MKGIDWLEEFEDFSAQPSPPTENLDKEPTADFELDRRVSNPNRVETSSVQEIQLGAQKPETVSEAYHLFAHEETVKPVRNRGRVIALRSVSSGAGRTVVATNLAFEIAGNGRSVCLVDLDSEFPTIHRYFGITSPKAAVLAGARLIEQKRLDDSALEQLMVRLVSKGVSVEFFSGHGLAQNKGVTSWIAVQELLEALARRYQVVIVDTPPGLGNEVHRLTDQLCDQQLWVTQPDAVSLGRFIDAQPEITNSGFSGGRLLAVNRVRTSVLGARPDWQVQQVLKDRTTMKISAMLPQDDAFDQAMLQGLPLRQVAGRSKSLAAISQLAQRLS